VPAKRQKLLDNMMAVGTLELKVDAQVMLVKNVSETLVNGSVGRVLAFEDDVDGTRVPLVEFQTFKGLETVPVSRDEFRAEDSEGKLLAKRIQVGTNLSRRSACSSRL
jgi:ATP-dependent DNA helicase PIF1